MRRAAGLPFLLVLALLAGLIWVATRPEATPPPGGTQAKPQAERAPPVKRRTRSRPRASAAPRARGTTTDDLTGRIVFADGTPAVGARVRAWGVAQLWQRKQSRLGAEVVADEEGRVAFAKAPPDDRVVLYAVLPGYQTAGEVLETRDLPVTFEMVLGEEGTLGLGQGVQGGHGHVT